MPPESVDIAPFLRPRVGLMDLVRPEATLYFVLGYGAEMRGLFFQITGKGFSLNLNCDGDRIIFLRNDIQVSVDLAPKNFRKGKFLLTVLWSADKLFLSIHDDSGLRRLESPTPQTTPPNSLIELIRRSALEHQNTYISADNFFEEVVAQLQILTDRIYANNAFDQFWDTTREGNQIIARKPKREVEIHTSIKLLLDPLEIQRGWNIAPESPIGAGNLDFLITGRLSDGRSVHICVEFKLAHSSDLAHGLFTQLPEYMDKKVSDYGVYCVINFGGEYSAKVNQFGLKEFRDPECSLDLALPVAANNTGKMHIRALIIDVSKPLPPSKNK